MCLFSEETVEPQYDLCYAVSCPIVQWRRVLLQHATPLSDPHACSQAAPLLHNDRQIHAWMDQAQDMIGARDGKRPDLNAAAFDLPIANQGRARFSRGFRLIILPDPIGQNVNLGTVIHQDKA